MANLEWPKLNSVVLVRSEDGLEHHLDELLVQVDLPEDVTQTLCCKVPQVSVFVNYEFLEDGVESSKILSNWL